jgi:hypothetical protein
MENEQILIEYKHAGNEFLNVTAHHYETKQQSNFAPAFVAFQLEMCETEIGKDQNKKIKNKNGGYRELKYASFDNILKYTRPVLAKNGLFVMQALSGEFIETIIEHSSGEKRGFLTPFEPMTGSGTSSMQNIGGGITYLSRYAYKSALGLSLEDDNDGDDQPGKKAEVLPEISDDEMEIAANVFVSKKSLATVQASRYIPEMKLATIYVRAKEICLELKANAAEEKPEAKKAVKAKAKPKKAVKA